MFIKNKEMVKEGGRRDFKNIKVFTIKELSSRDEKHKKLLTYFI